MIALRWASAIAGSAAAHALALGALALSLAPDPPPDQPSPETRFSIAAQEVTRKTAAALEAPAAPVDETRAATTAARQGVVAQTTARVATPAGQTVQTVALRAPRAAATEAQGNRLGAVPAPQATAGIVLRQTPVAAALPVVARVEAARPRAAAPLAASPARPARAAQAVAPPGSPLTAAEVAGRVAPPLSAPDAARLAALSPPDTPAQAATAPQGSRIASAPADAGRPDALIAEGTPAAEAVAAASAAADLPLPAIKRVAELAWSGQGDTLVGATSLAAIAAFTREGELGASAREVRDGIAGILAAVPCARLQTTFNPDTGVLELRGHVPEDGLRAPVLAALRAQVGEAIPLSDRLLILPRPQCGALAGIAEAGLPQSTEQLTNPRVIGADGFARTYTYADGQRLHLDLVAPDYDAYVYVDYFVADGSVIHLQPNDIVPLEIAAAKSPLSVGRDRGDGPSLELTIGAPFGQEIAAAFATSVPLYEGLRPIQEPAAPYLAFLKERVAALRAEDPAFKGEWVYFFITTTPQ